MSYVLVVNPSILSAGGNAPLRGLINRNRTCGNVSHLAYALMTNYPIANGTGMGLNGLFRFLLFLPHPRDPWDAALGIDFGNWLVAVFTLISQWGTDQNWQKANTRGSLKLGAMRELGFCSSHFIGLTNAGIRCRQSATFVNQSVIYQTRALLACLVSCLTIVLFIKKVPGAILISKCWYSH